MVAALWDQMIITELKRNQLTNKKIYKLYGNNTTQTTVDFQMGLL